MQNVALGRPCKGHLDESMRALNKEAEHCLV